MNHFCNARPAKFASARRFLVMLVAGMLSLAHAIAVAAPLAGTSIGNQATATYTDDTATVRTVTSNTVVTIVQQVASFTLTANGAKPVAPGGNVSYPHTLTHTGNGPDSFNLTTVNTGAFSFSTVAIYADANGDGIPDNTTPITGTGTLSPGSVFNFVVVGSAAGSVVAGTTSVLTVNAASAFNAGVTASNTNTTTASGNAVVQVTKAIDVASGSSSGTRTFTLSYSNTGNTAATSLLLTDLLPSGMTYVPNSARWSNGGATVLTDLDSGDDQGGIVYDFNVSVANRVTATIASVPSGASGRLTFQVTINAGLAAGAAASTRNTAVYGYNDGAINQPLVDTNTVQYRVLQGAAVTLTGATVASATQGGTALFTNVLTNTGNGTDSFDITLGASTFPVGTTFLLLRADGVTPLLDTDGNGIPDSGPLAAGASLNIVVRAVLPTNASGGPFTVQVIATSTSNNTQSATATDTLTSITASSVDLTADSAGPGAPGVGAGPEASAVVTNAVNPGATTRFTLFVANGVGQADAFNLQASTDSSFGTISLPNGWSVTFRNASGAVIGATAVIASGASQPVFADVTLPANAPAGTQALFFRAISSVSGTSDRLRNAVTVNTVRSLSLTPNHSGQTHPGGSVVYRHVLENTGNVTEGATGGSQVILSANNAASGFATVVYWDKNNDGVLDAGDPVLTDLATLTGGSNGASTAEGLDPGERATLLVKISTPPGGAVGTVNTGNIVATTTGILNGNAAPSAAVATTSTTLIAGQLQLVKLQALDAACDGTADTAFSAATVSTGAIPGSCLRYQLTVSNLGTADANAVVISDATPANTTYHAVVPAAVGQGTVATPTAGASGTVSATVGVLVPGQAVVLTFGVRINP